MANNSNFVCWNYVHNDNHKYLKFLSIVCNNKVRRIYLSVYGSYCAELFWSCWGFVYTCACNYNFQNGPKKFNDNWNDLSSYNKHWVRYVILFWRWSMADVLCIQLYYTVFVRLWWFSCINDWLFISFIIVFRGQRKVHRICRSSSRSWFHGRPTVGIHLLWFCWVYIHVLSLFRFNIYNFDAYYYWSLWKNKHRTKEKIRSWCFNIISCQFRSKKRRNWQTMPWL